METPNIFKELDKACSNNEQAYKEQENTLSDFDEFEEDTIYIYEEDYSDTGSDTKDEVDVFFDELEEEDNSLLDLEEYVEVEDSLFEKGYLDDFEEDEDSLFEINYTEFCDEDLESNPVVSRQKAIFNNKLRKGFNTAYYQKEVRYILEEVVELMKAVENNDIDNMAEELADITIFCYGLAEMINKDLDEEIDRKIVINSNREYEKDIFGTLRKVK